MTGFPNTLFVSHHPGVVHAYRADDPRVGDFAAGIRGEIPPEAFDAVASVLASQNVTVVDHRAATYAVLTTDPDGRLTPDSTIAIGDRALPVPRRHARGGALAPHRIWETLEGLGYEPATDYFGDMLRGAPGVTYIDVVPLGSKS